MNWCLIQKKKKITRTATAVRRITSGGTLVRKMIVAPWGRPIAVAICARFDMSSAVIFAGETRIGVGQRVGPWRIAAVERRIAAQSSAQDEIVGCHQC